MAKLVSLLCSLALLLSLTQAAEACTGIRIITEDGLVFSSRTLELNVLVPTKVMVIPKGTVYQGTLPGNIPKGLKWTSKHGHVIMGLSGTRLGLDGINEKGLAAGFFELPGVTEYQSYDPKKAGVTIAHVEMLTWLLSNFATVAEVRQAIGKVQVCQGVTEGLESLPVHVSVHDAQGKSLVIEYIGGKAQLHDNPLGVITNAPTFDWMLTYLKNFINLSPVNVPQREYKGLTMTQIGQGSGLVGLPGDFSSPSRFVRMVALTQGAVPVKGAAAGLSLTMNIISNVNIPIGAVRQVSDKQTAMELTQWATLSDLHGLKYYFRTYDNNNWRYVDVVKALAGATEIKTISLDSPPDYPDVTSQAK
jgi:choloylglycine hydrolase